MANILQTTFTNTFDWNDIIVQISLKFVPKAPIKNQSPSIYSCYGLAPNRRQAITWANDDPVHWHKYLTWWRHQMKAFSALLSLCEGNPPVTGGFPSHRDSNAELWYVSLICAWTNIWANNRDTGGLRHHRTHYDVTVMNKWDISRSCGWADGLARTLHRSIYNIHVDPPMLIRPTLLIWFIPAVSGCFWMKRTARYHRKQ